MAIHEELPDIKVTIEVDGVPLVEHKNSNDPIKHNDPLVRAHQSGCTVTNYVECKTGKFFCIRASINFTHKWDSPSLTFYVYVDGENISGEAVTRKNYKNKEWNYLCEGPVSGITGEHGMLRRLKFTAVHTTSETADATKIQNERDRMSKVGEIVVQVHRTSEVVLIPKTSRSIRGPSNNFDNDVNEKALKGEAKSHGASLGAAEKKRIVGYSAQCSKLDGNDYPIAIYKFKYRSNEALKQLRIIERTPEPDDNNIFEGLTGEQLREVRKFARRVKRERDDGGPIKLDDNTPSLKPGGSKKLRSSIPQVIIDLTEE